MEFSRKKYPSVNCPLQILFEPQKFPRTRDQVNLRQYQENLLRWQVWLFIIGMELKERFAIQFFWAFEFGLEDSDIEWRISGGWYSYYMSISTPEGLICILYDIPVVIFLELSTFDISVVAIHCDLCLCKVGGLKHDLCTFSYTWCRHVLFVILIETSFPIAQDLRAN